MKIPWCCIGWGGLGGGAPYRSGHIQTGNRNTGLPGVVLAEQNAMCRMVFLVSPSSFLHATPNEERGLTAMAWMPVLSGWSLFSVREELMRCETCLSSWVLSHCPKWTCPSRILSPPPSVRSRSSLEGVPSGVRFSWRPQSSRDCVSASHRMCYGCDTETWHRPSSGDTHFPGCLALFPFLFCKKRVVAPSS